jgi:glycosyltransferase involved in cell wall biosynthesis
MPPGVSLCIPTYNQVDSLRKVLDSVAAQDFGDYEIIVTDDSPGDSISQLLREYSFKGEVRYFKNSVRKGSPENWNQAIRHASGDYIKVLHHDDWFTESDSLSKYVSLLEDAPEADFAFSATRIVDYRDGSTRLHLPSAEQLERLRFEPTSLFMGNFVGSPSATLYRNSSMQWYDKNLKWLVDVDFYIRLLQGNNSFVYSREVLIATLDESPNSVTSECQSNPLIGALEYCYLFEKIKDNLPEANRKQYVSYLDERLEISNVVSVRQIRLSGFKGSLPDELSGMIRRRRILAALCNRPVRRLKNAARKIFPQTFRSKIARWKKVAAFRSSFGEFSRQPGAERLPLDWKNRKPCLDDDTGSTSFDRHYVYHPAWAARILERVDPEFHIDIGSSLFFVSVASAFLPIRFYDFRPANLRLKNLDSERADLTNLQFKDRSIKSLSCMHVVEHIGLGRYGDPIDPDADLKAMSELQRVLSPNGDLLFVVPVGQPHVEFNAHRVYSYRQIIEQFSDLTLREFALIPEHGPEGLIRGASEDRVLEERYGCGCFWFSRR